MLEEGWLRDGRSERYRQSKYLEDSADEVSTILREEYANLRI